MKYILALLAMLDASSIAAQEMVVPYERNYPPFSTTKLDGTADGYNIAVARALAERAGYDITLRPVNFFEISDGDWPDNWAYAVASVSLTETRKEHFTFVGEYLFDEIVAIASTLLNADATLPGAGDKIGVCNSCVYRDYLEGNYTVDGHSGEPPFPSVDINSDFSSETSMIEAMIVSDDPPFDYMVVSRFFAEFQFIVNQFPITVVGEPLYRDPLWVVASHNNPEVQANLKQALNSLRDDGTLAALSEEFLGANFTNLTP